MWVALKRAVGFLAVYRYSWGSGSPRDPPWWAPGHSCSRPSSADSCGMQLLSVSAAGVTTHTWPGWCLLRCRTSQGVCYTGGRGTLPAEQRALVRQVTAVMLSFSPPLFCPVHINIIELDPGNRLSVYLPPSPSSNISPTASILMRVPERTGKTLSSQTIDFRVGTGRGKLEAKVVDLV